MHKKTEKDNKKRHNKHKKTQTEQKPQISRKMQPRKIHNANA